jgi:ceroid-lipofuscinosis neuronal protein 6
MNLFLIILVMGASIHLVGDSINHRLSLVGYQYHLSLEENPIMKELKPRDLVKSFDLLYFYDEVLGHYMWYIPYFGCLMLYFQSCFKPQVTPSTSKHKTKNSNNDSFSIFELIVYRLLVLISASYYWYLVTEGQITPLFLFTIGFMLFSILLNSNSKLDQNGWFLLETFLLTLVFVAVWCYWLWDDKELRRKYTSIIYVSETII